eukprot:TRINITY_DN25665_c0_g1_i1.p1 TRINITY_DN25665_c0_g1~~TRINITY_DN25665_c0_g1_i1.p1  ORF type:complete len:105 (-),score=31.60 TRINITY_DN25665_c0_g1_i1:69-383(-)
MRYIAAYLLAQITNESPTDKDVKKIITAVGGECDDAQLKNLFTQLEGKDIKELIAEGTKKMASCGGGGGGGAAPAAAKEEAPAAAAAAPAEESEDGDMGFGLFD